MARVGRKTSGRLVGIRRLNRASLMRGTALQAAVLVAVELPGGILPATAQPAPNAQPQGGSVVAGQASIAQTPTTTTITQSSQRAAINWTSFNVGRNETVDFQQPSASAWTLNRVTGPDPSQIAGRIDANGNIVLTNGAGVVFYRGSEVNAGSVVVSAPGITNRNFMARRMVFDQAPNPGARIVNAGKITVKQTGLAALVAPQVANRGEITAKFGHVVLAGARTDTLDMYGDGLFAFDVTGAVRQIPHGPDGKPLPALVTNTGLVRADGSTVELTARAVDGFVQDLVDAKGRIRANTAGGQTGNIVVEGTGGSIKVAGDVSATGARPSQQGGEIELDASRSVVVGRHAEVDASGGAGGGTVAAGTTLARAAGGPAVAATHTAAGVLIKHGATIAADATELGSGGKVAVLSRRATAMRGTITARGGAAGGNGGTVEVSGKRDFALTGSVNVENRGRGQPGTILLDPTDLTIVNGDGTSDSFVNNGTLLFNQGPAQAQVGNALLDQLAGNIVLQATNNLNVNASFSGTSTVDLRAGHLLTLASGTTITADDVILHGGENFSTGGATGNGGVVINATALIQAFGSFGVSGHGTIELAAGSLGIQENGTLESSNAIVLVATGGNMQLGANSFLSTNVLDVSTIGSGNVRQAGTNTALISVGTLDSSQGLAGNVDLTSTRNRIQTLGNFVDSAGSIAVTSAEVLEGAGLLDLDVTGTVSSPTGLTFDSLGPLTVSGILTAPTISLTATQNGTFEPGDIHQTGGSIAAANSLIMNADGSIAQSNGAVIIAGTLSGSTGNSLVGGETGGTVLNSAGNQIGNVGNFSSVGGFTLADTGTLTLSGSLSDASGIALTTTGAIQQTAGAIATGGLDAAAGGSISLTSASNTISSLLFVSSTNGDISIASNALRLFEPVTVSNGHSIALTTDTLSFVRAGALTAPAGTV
ncbi:MAG: filamentous hemagglutinin N-terminal domain-containing protein, partial [Alphaproteobacteria bacterium]|nr:filamentous hemagglutinin N-terminal domain-containing protein [Alphaproteobacteria bacterium]